MVEQTETTVDTTNFESLLAQISENGSKIAANLWVYNLQGLSDLLDAQSKLYSQAAEAVQEFMHKDGQFRLPPDES